jgi:N6-L-threonylcarbamoyladenine synthase
MALVAIGEPAASPGRAAALAATLRDHPVPAAAAATIAAAAQDAIVAALVHRVDRALAATPGASLIVGGGVAANVPLRERLGVIAARHGRTLNIPPVRWCTDNAAMIGAAAHAALREGRALEHDPALGVNVSSSWPFGEAAPL